MDSRKDAAIVADDSEKELPEATLSEFFETKPANVKFRIISNEEFDLKFVREFDSLDLRLPSIRLWCNSAQCQNVRVFQPKTLALKLQKDKIRDSVVDFVCCDCREGTKKYAFWAIYRPRLKLLAAGKVGEDPPLSYHLPSRLRKLIGTDQEKFNKGLRSESHGLGVGAFAYYRQVVENQKDRLLEGIIKVANLKNPPPKLIKELEDARRQTR